VRTRPIGGLAALIAVLALVALAGPAETRTPGTAAGTGPVAFAPLVLPSFRATAATVTVPATRDPGSEVVAPVLVESGAARIPARPRVPAIPAVRAVPVQKVVPQAVAAPKRQPTKAAVTGASVTTSSGGSWHVAGYSWYGPGFYGHGTACGQTLTRSLLGVANKTLPCGTQVTLRNPSNGRSITVRVVDRGPYVSGRMWDLTSATCGAIGACYTGRIQYRIP
jgi:rare lipoprotein A (peptidoglycan hydrolase)